MKQLTALFMIAFVAAMLVISGCGKSSPQGINSADSTNPGSGSQQGGAVPVTDGNDFDNVAEDEVTIGELV